MSTFHGIEAASAIDALVIAAGQGKLEAMKSLLADGTDINGKASAPLGNAADNGAVRSVELLLANARQGMTPLMNACSTGQSKGSKAAMFLIQAGADVNHVVSGELTALKFAVERCSADVVQALIDKGADVDGPPGTEQTALMIAARANNPEALSILVKHGADLTLRCQLPWAQGRTAEGLAILEKQKKAIAFFASLGK